MRVVQVSRDEVVDVVPVRHGLVAAAGTVDVHGRMRAAGMRRGADGGVRTADGDAMLVDVVAVHVVQVTVVQVIDVTVVRDGDVAAARAMDVGMLAVLQAIGHRRVLRVPPGDPPDRNERARTLGDPRT
jgi:hypothetical protein